MTLFRPRPWFLFVALACAGMLGYALYVQHFDFVDPCPLCVLQRMAFMWIGAVALLAFIHNPGFVGRRFYGLGVIVGAREGRRGPQSLRPAGLPGAVQRDRG